jgi:ABC-type uncharacterized transport system auxiliary subunit
LAIGCAGSVPASRFFVIAYEVEPLGVNPPLDLVLGVEPFSTQPLYRDRRIAYRTSEHTIVYYPYCYWAAGPGELVADQLANHLRKTRLLRAVEAYPFGESPDWVLSGHVQQFEEIARGGRSVARLELSVRLESVEEGRILREEVVEIEKPLTGRSPEHTAAAMSAAVREAGQRVVAIVQELAPHP